MPRQSMSSQPGARAIAALTITRILTHKLKLSSVLPDYLQRLENKKDRPLTQELCYGVLRWYFLLEYIMGSLIAKDLKAKDTDIKILIMIGLYQFIFLRTPPHAIISATVEACNELKKPWTKGLVNAVLRRYQRESEYLHKKAETELTAKYAHPEWLLEILQKNYPELWTDIIAANNSYPPMFLRINSGKLTRNEYLSLLNKAGIIATPAPYCDSGLRLDEPVDVEQLPEFRTGFVSVQDLAAQLTPGLLDLKPGQRVLDACAAPGGKLAHILESAHGLQEVVALESDKSRFERLQQTLIRLQLNARLFCADARQSSDWWDGLQFDRILLDAPCSATGVIRRHPDIKVLRTPEDIETIRILQSELVNALWPLLKTGGKLLYVTCSILPCENELQIREFIDTHDDAGVIMINADWGTAGNYGRQILPGQDDMDGFYYACLQKK